MCNGRNKPRGFELETYLTPLPNPHPFPFLSEDGLGADGESASLKLSRAPVLLPACALCCLSSAREAGDGCERGG